MSVGARFLVVLLLLLAAAPTAPANAEVARCQTASSMPCTFTCHAGDVLAASGIAVSGLASASASCGGASASCSRMSDCLDAGAIVQEDGTGTCTFHSGQYADCFALPAETSGQCATMIDYGACSFSCSANGAIAVEATSTISGGYPRVLAKCGGTSVQCQSYMACQSSGTAAARGAGICLSRTASTSVRCQAETDHEPRCQATSGTCQFTCRAGDVLAASGIATSGTARAAAACGGAEAGCSGLWDCLDAGSIVQYDGTGTCTFLAGQYADCFALAPSTAEECSTSIAYAACTFTCEDREIVSVAATSSISGGYPRVLSECAGVNVSCQAEMACVASAMVHADGAGVCLSRTDSTTILCKATSYEPRCQATSDTCQFTCIAGEVLGASGIALTGRLTGASATCGGASAECSGSSDCLDGGAIVAYDDVGTCTLTQSTGQYADCFALPPPTGPTCASAADYDVCTFSCTAYDILLAKARSTSPGGYPRILSLCGGTHVDCQAANACENLGQAASGGAGLCLSRTARTEIECKVLPVPESAPARCSIEGGYCFVSCRAGDVVAASAFGPGAHATVLCGGAQATCAGAPDCLAVADRAAATRVGICTTGAAGAVADCFSLAPPRSAPVCGTTESYAACAFPCQAGEWVNTVAVGRALGSFPRVLAACGTASIACQASMVCSNASRTDRTGAGVCLSRTVDTTIACVSTKA